MSEYQMVFTYLSALVGLAIVAAVVVGGVLWSKLKTGANNTDVPSPAAP